MQRKKAHIVMCNFFPHEPHWPIIGLTHSENITKTAVEEPVSPIFMTKGSDRYISYVTFNSMEQALLVSNI